MAKDFTLEEARQAFGELAARIGSKCEIYPTLTAPHHAVGEHPRKGLVSAQVYPRGITAKVTLWPTGNSWRELIADCEAKWAAHSDLHATNIIRDMALAIISITADLGECTDAALRAKFDAADIQRHGDAACAQATEMAANGPFSIVKLSGANDAEAA